MPCRIGILGSLCLLAAACANDSTSASVASEGGSSGGSSGASGSSGSSGSSSGGAAGSGTSSGDGGSDICSTCKGGEVCVEHETQGGPLILADAGRCPSGRVPVPSGSRTICELAPSFECAALPATCNNPPGTPALAHCTCARELCGSANLCQDVSLTLMKCTLQAP